MNNGPLASAIITCGLFCQENKLIEDDNIAKQNAQKSQRLCSINNHSQAETLLQFETGELDSSEFVIFK